ncbi:MAG: efflux RND transporter periplasmic adaptor subunit [Lentisphaeria bacterium]|nr:efflux RND transporter periplasmic adaptor subunit [Lentisphaeria bacterium]
MKTERFFGIIFLCAAFLCCASADDHPVKVVLFPYREAILVSQIDGTIRQYFFRAGQHFKEGDCLLAFDDTPFRLELDRVTARRQEIEVQLKLAQETYLSQKKLFEQDFQSKLEIQKREAEVETLKARLKGVQADCAEAALRVGYCRRKAPFAGRIEQIMCREHETVRTGQPLFRIIYDRELLAVMNIPLGDLKPVGTELAFVFDKKRYTGRIHEISPQADHRSGTIEIKALVSNAEGALICGMTGELVKTAPGSGPSR